MPQDSHDVLHEKLFSELRAIRQHVESLLPLTAQVAGIARGVVRIESDVIVLKDVVTGHSRDIAAIKEKVWL